MWNSISDFMSRTAKSCISGISSVSSRIFNGFKNIFNTFKTGFNECYEHKLYTEMKTYNLIVSDPFELNVLNLLTCTTLDLIVIYKIGLRVQNAFKNLNTPNTPKNNLNCNKKVRFDDKVDIVDNKTNYIKNKKNENRRKYKINRRKYKINHRKR